MSVFPDGFTVTAALGLTRLILQRGTLADALAAKATYEDAGWTCGEPVPFRDSDVSNVTPILGHTRKEAK